VQQRIKEVYGIDATVVHPPHGLDPTASQEPVDAVADWEGFYLVVSRLMPYKNVDVVVDAFRDLPAERLAVIGRGPLAAQLRAAAPGNVRFLEGLSDAELRWAYANCRAVIAPSREDYGLTPVEGFSFGRPCLALRSGGYLEPWWRGSAAGSSMRPPRTQSARRSGTWPTTRSLSPPSATTPTCSRRKPSTATCRRRSLN
jgi:glycosyltransferase involved in cell wall biosynthesis